MTTSRRHVLEVVSILSIAIALLASPASARQDAAGAHPAGASKTSPIPKDATLAMVTSDNVYIRSGGADSYYPFGRLKKGDLVVVIGEKYDWARILTRGPCFDGFFGYVSTPHSATPHYRLENSDRTLRTVGRVDLLAPNHNTAYKPKDSWKRILEVGPDRDLAVLETISTDRAVVHKVVLPDDAEGWISRSFLAPATEEQVTSWTKLVLQGKKATVAGGTTPRPVATSGDTAARAASSVLPTAETSVPPVKSPAETPAAEVPAMTMGPPDPRPEATTARPDDATADAPRAATPATPRANETHRVPQDTAITPPSAERVVNAPESDSDTADAAPSAAVTSVLPHIEGPLSARKAQTTFESLEEAYLRLRDEPIRTAEVQPLRLLYLQLAEASANSAVVERYANARAEQLTLWGDLQKRRAELDRLRKRIDVSADEAEAMRLAMDAMGDYTVAGRLEASTIFSGGAMPLLYRVQDTTTGRTLAYLRPDAGFELGPMLGQLVGITGDMTRDGELQVNLLQPRRIDLLASGN